MKYLERLKTKRGAKRLGTSGARLDVLLNNLNIRGSMELKKVEVSPKAAEWRI